MPRLPQPGSDEGTWGEILNDYLTVAHATDGTLRPGIVTPSALAAGSVTSSKLAASAPASGQVLSYGGTSLEWVTPSSGVTDHAQLSGVGTNTHDQIDSALADSAVHIAATNNPHNVTKAQVGLDSVDNTSDADKPLSTAMQTALDGKADASHTHTATQITDATAIGQAVLTATDAAAARTTIGAGTSSFDGVYASLTGKPTLGTAAAADMNDFATAAQGAKADTATQPGHLHAAADVTSGILASARLGSGTADVTTFLRGDSTWGTPASSAQVGIPKRTGTVISGLTHGSSAAASAAHIADRVVAHVIYLPYDTSIDRFGCRVLTAGAGATLRFGICADSGAGLPGDVLYTHAGTLDCSTTGEKTITVTHTIPAGTYWAVAQTGGAGCVTRTAGAESFFVLGRTDFATVGDGVSIAATRTDGLLAGSLAGLVWGDASTNLPHGVWMRTA